MTETAEAPMGVATQPAEATKIVGKQLESKTDKGKSSPPNSDLSKMTGAEAKAYVESQKAKKDPVKEAVKEVVVKKASKKEEAAPAPEAKEPPRKHKVTIDGKEEEIDEIELKRGYGHQKAANKILQEGVAARKQAEEFIAMMKDPKTFFDVASKLGHDARKLSEEFLASKLEEELMDPRDRELKATKAKLKELEDMDKKQKEAVEAQRHETLKKKFALDYSNQFIEALKETQIPSSKEMVQEMAKYVHRAAKLGFKMTAKEAASLVKEDLETKIQKVVRESDIETLLRIIGDQTMNKLREHDVSKLKSPESYLKTPEVQGEPREKKNPNRRMTREEWRAFNRGA